VVGKYVRTSGTWPRPGIRASVKPQTDLSTSELLALRRLDVQRLQAAASMRPWDKRRQGSFLMNFSVIDLELVAKLLLLLPIGLGPKIALVPFLEKT
jgi:hypothetical protein